MRIYAEDLNRIKALIGNADVEVYIEFSMNYTAIVAKIDNDDYYEYITPEHMHKMGKENLLNEFANRAKISLK